MRPYPVPRCYPRPFCGAVYEVWSRALVRNPGKQSSFLHTTKSELKAYTPYSAYSTALWDGETRQCGSVPSEVRATRSAADASSRKLRRPGDREFSNSHRPVATLVFTAISQHLRPWSIVLRLARGLAKPSQYKMMAGSSQQSHRQSFHTCFPKLCHFKLLNIR